MKLVKFRPIREAFRGKTYQKMLSPGAKKIEPTVLTSKGGTPEYYRKKYKTLKGRVRYNPVVDKTVEKAKSKLVPLKQKGKRFKRHLEIHGDLLKRKIESNPKYVTAALLGVNLATIPAVYYLDKKLSERSKNIDNEVRKSNRKQRSDKGKKRGPYKK